MANEYNSSEGGFIDYEEASQLHGNYISSSCYANNNNIKAHFFGKDKLATLLQKPGAVGVRMYYGKKSSGDPVLLIVAVDSDGNEMRDQILDYSLPCPHHCSAVPF